MVHQRRASATRGWYLCAVAVAAALLLLAGSSSWAGVQVQRQKEQPASMYPPANARLRALYTRMGSGVTFEHASGDGVAEFVKSRRFFQLEGGRWRPARITPFMDLGVAVPLDPLGPALDALLAEIRAAVPSSSALYIAPRGHHCTMQHLCNNETLVKKHLDNKAYVRLLHERYIPAIAELLASPGPGEQEVTLTFEKLALSGSDGSLVLLGTAEPDGVLHEIRRRWWGVFESLGVAGVRSEMWDVLHSTVARFQPAVDGPGMAVTRAQFEALNAVVDAYNSRPSEKKLRLSFRPASAIRYLHNREMFSASTYDALRLAELVAGAPRLTRLMQDISNMPEP
eukprot:Rhum_TRINITY_DN10052_c0_g1::Rhum_TRINITY_DN10052_c0_g1_i1::g.36539::m.36539